MAARRGKAGAPGWERRPLLVFLALSFGITWSLGALVLAFGDALAARFGEMDLRAPFWKAFFHAAVYGPAFAAFATVALHHGRAGVARFARGLLRGFGAAPRWWAAALFGFASLQIGGRALANAWAGDDAPLFGFEPWWTLVPAFLLHLVDDPGGVEEIGWRGLALPLLQQRFSAATASVVLGLVWGLWHLPAFAIAAAPQAGFSLPAFLLGSIALALVMTALYNASGGSVPVLYVAHSMANFGFGTEGAGPAGEMAITALLFFAVAGVVIARAGAARMARRKVTDPLGPEPG